MIITIGGSMGSGKSVVSRKLAEKLNWPVYSMGNLRRQKAKERGMSLAEYNKMGEADSSTDLEIDLYQQELGASQDNFVIEGRTSWYFIPQSFKIFLDIDQQTGANHIWKDLQRGVERNEDGNLQSLNDVLNSIRKRIESDKLRYKTYFNIDVYDKTNYDLVIDTTDRSLDDVCEQIYQEVKKRMNKG